MTSASTSRILDVRRFVDAELAAVLGSVIATIPASWAEPKGADPMRALDIMRANRRIREGRTVHSAALEVAVTRAVRLFGWKHVAEAARADSPRMVFASKRGIA